MRAFQAWYLSGVSIPNSIILQREKQLKEIADTLFFCMKKKNKSDAIRKFKEYLLLSARLSLLKKGIVPASKKNTFELYQKSEKIDIKKIYGGVNEKNIKELVTKYVG